jgi:hypothetical protein
MAHAASDRKTPMSLGFIKSVISISAVCDMLVLYEYSPVWYLLMDS